MLVKDFFKWANETTKTELELMQKKGIEYTVSNSDKLANFKSIGKRLNMPPELVVMVYFLKHVDSLTNYVLHGTEASDEPIEGRLMDIRNYALLMGAVIKEKKENGAK